MGRDIVKNLKFKKHSGKHFDPEKFAQLLDESYRNTKRADGEMTKNHLALALLDMVTELAQDTGIWHLAVQCLLTIMMR